jgi:hypothetical protein
MFNILYQYFTFTYYENITKKNLLEMQGVEPVPMLSIKHSLPNELHPKLLLKFTMFNILYQ